MTLGRHASLLSAVSLCKKGRRCPEVTQVWGAAQRGGSVSFLSLLVGVGFTGEPYSLGVKKPSMRSFVPRT